MSTDREQRLFKLVQRDIDYAFQEIISCGKCHQMGADKIAAHSGADFYRHDFSLRGYFKFRMTRAVSYLQGIKRLECFVFYLLLDRFR